MLLVVSINWLACAKPRTLFKFNFNYQINSFVHSAKLVWIIEWSFNLHSLRVPIIRIFLVVSSPFVIVYLCWKSFKCIFWIFYKMWLMIWIGELHRCSIHHSHLFMNRKSSPVVVFKLKVSTLTIICIQSNKTICSDVVKATATRAWCEMPISKTCQRNDKWQTLQSFDVMCGLIMEISQSKFRKSKEK